MPDVTITTAMATAAATTLGYPVTGLSASEVRSRLRYKNASAEVEKKGAALTAKEAHNLIADKMAPWYPGIKKIK